MKTNIKVGAIVGAFSVLALGNLSGNAFADTTYTSTDFPDEAFFNCVKSNAGLTSDISSITSITQAQAESITNLNCPDVYQFSDATGIELLTKMQKLTIEKQENLKTLDLSKNTSLSDSIVIQDNPKLKTLKFGQAPNVKTLFAKNNALQSLDIAGLTGLSLLNVTNNSLSSIDLSKNKALESLTASNNKLSDIDLTANTSLTHAYLYGNDFKYIDVSKINKSLLGLWLDDNVLVRTNFVAVQTTDGGNYYASPSTNSGTSGMFIPMMVATGLDTVSNDKTVITTPGAVFHLKDDLCGAVDPFCIIFDADILNYQNYIQLKYAGGEATESEIQDGRDKSKRNYRLEINLEAYSENIPVPDTSANTPSTKTPNTGVFSGENSNVVNITISLISIAIITGSIHTLVYGARRFNNKVKFNSKKF